MDAVTAKASNNYSEDMISSIMEEYNNNPTRETVDSLARTFNKTPRSIIAKLSALGVYKKVERVTKRGEPVVLKQELVNEISKAFGKELTSLNKVNKQDLTAMLRVLSEKLGV